MLLFVDVEMLRCIDQCSMIYSIDDKFTIPNHCNSTNAYRCSVELIFRYDRRNYSVHWTSENSSRDDFSTDERQFLMIETVREPFFSHSIQQTCRNKDFCHVDLVHEILSRLVQRSFNTTMIFSSLKRILYQPYINNSNLACFDMNNDVRQCSIPGMIGYCQMVDDLIKSKLHKSSCKQNDRLSASVNIYDSGYFALITINCNRMLCNGPLTIDAVKRILRYHNITNYDDRLSLGNRIQLSTLLFLFLIFGSRFSPTGSFTSFTMRERIHYVAKLT